ncbi:carotenoid oxygenase family protein [Streptomyces sp. NBC_01431]|uniref:carotenoid oxygenase family protein n=1 Tax=Streptomyces sp. NBC_01431 TaxID=2903863 RepID=UPI003FCD84FB
MKRSAGPGRLLGYGYDAARDASDPVILDAENVSDPPVATVHLPRRVPFGLHGKGFAGQ